MIIAHVVVVGDTHGSAHRQEIRSGRHSLVADEPIHLGGADAGPPPFAYLLSGLGACTSITLRMYADKKKWDIGTVTVTLDLSDGPSGKEIRRSVELSGSLTEEQRTRLADVCERTPVTLVLKNGIGIDTRLSVQASAQ